MKTPLIAAVLMLAATPLWATPAAPTANIKAVERLLELSHADNMAQQMQLQIQNLLNQQAQQLNASTAERPIVDKYIKELSTTVLPELAWSKLKPDLVKAYSTTFTDGEIADLSAFYASKTGQSYLQKAPELGRQTVLLTQARLQGLLPKVRDISRRMEADLQAQRKAAAPALPKK
jgi:hypothetical protein